MNATRYLADRHVCGCFRFTLASSHLPTCGEGTGAVFQGESRPCPPLHRGVLEASFVYNSATGSDQSISSALLTHLDPTSSPNIALDRPTNRVKTRGHVFANERSIVFLRSNMRCVALHSSQASRFSKIGFGQERVSFHLLTTVFSRNCAMHPLFLVRFFATTMKKWTGKWFPSCFLSSFHLSSRCLVIYIYYIVQKLRVGAYKRTNLLEMMRIFPSSPQTCTRYHLSKWI